HKERPFFPSLVKFMTEGPVILMVLEADNAIDKLRKVMGATDPAKADAGTIRKQFGINIERNAIHGSDGPETAAFEIGYFFYQLDNFTFYFPLGTSILISVLLTLLFGLLNRR